MKKNKFIIFYSIFASLVILFALSYLGFNLITEYNHGYDRTKRRFEHLCTNIQKLTEKEFNSKQQYLNELEKNIGQISDFAFLEIKENDKTTFIYPSPEAKSENSSSLIRNFSKNFNISKTNFKISADLYILRPASIYYYSKISFIIILIITLITLIFVIYFNVRSTPQSSVNIQIQNDENSDSETETKSESDFNSCSQSETKTEQTEKNDDEVNVFEKALNENSKENNKKTEELTTEEKNEKPYNELPYKELETKNIDSLVPEETKNPEGLFSSETGLGWESYLMTRLDNELNRAISLEVDLSLFIIQIPGLLRNNPKIKTVCDYLISQFQFKDLIFEYQEDSIAAIKVNMNLDSAMNMADKIYAEIKNIIGQVNNCYIGISTRSIRMVSAERLLKEADEALLHAKEDSENPIIAFRVNVEKYKEFVEKNNN